MKHSENINLLPFRIQSITQKVNNLVIKSSRALSELKGVTHLIPNENILLNTISLQEAKESSEIENIITTYDEIFRSDSDKNIFVNNSTKEVYNYKEAMLKGYENVKKNGFISVNDLVEIQSIIIKNNAGIRKQAGTVIKNTKTNEVIFTPPQNEIEIINLLSNLEKFINDNALSSFDPLIKMALIHFQFGTIHPFYDGNGRTGRILNVLYLIKSGLLDSPVLYFSRYINTHKSEYYELLQKVRSEDDYEDWIIFMLNAVYQTSVDTIKLIRNIKELMSNYEVEIKEKLPKIYQISLESKNIHILLQHIQVRKASFEEFRLKHFWAF
ncbi:MAG: Fic family protein [Ignavibacteria bacterium]|nr:Fic family protein [Ignavibacteria bacterium]